jgi:hypothetical protein
MAKKKNEVEHKAFAMFLNESEQTVSFTVIGYEQITEFLQAMAFERELGNKDNDPAIEAFTEMLQTLVLNIISVSPSLESKLKECLESDIFKNLKLDAFNRYKEAKAEKLGKKK